MTVKDKMKKIINEIPEESTYDDIQYLLYIMQSIDEGEKDIAEGNTITHEEAKNRMAKWLK